VSVEIRPCDPSEIGAVLDLWRRAGATPSATDTDEAIARLIEAPQAALLAAYDGGTMAGTVIAGWDGWRGSVYRLAVAPSHRRRGIAAMLVEAAGRELATMGARRISALVEHDHPLAVGFWDAAERIGYHRDPRMVRYVATREQ